MELVLWALEPSERSEPICESIMEMPLNCKQEYNHEYGLYIKNRVIC